MTAESEPRASVLQIVLTIAAIPVVGILLLCAILSWLYWPSDRPRRVSTAARDEADMLAERRMKQQRQQRTAWWL